MNSLQDAIVSDPDIRGCVPVIRGTRMPLAQLLGELASGMTVTSFAKEYDLDPIAVKDAMTVLAVYFNRSFIL